MNFPSVPVNGAFGWGSRESGDTRWVFPFRDFSGRGMKTRATVALAVLIGILVVVAGVVEMYAQCGPLCRQGLLLAQRERP